MQNYMGSGYKTPRAVELSGLSKRPGESGSGGEAFMAPGVPVETLRPPPPTVPPAAAAGAAGGAAGGALAGGFAVGAAVGGGLAVGAYVKVDIDGFKAKGVMPAYDTDYVYRPGKGLKTAYDEELWRGVIPEFDWKTDQEIQQRHQALIDEWLSQPISWPAGMFDPLGRHGPIFVGSNFWNTWEWVNDCPGNTSQVWISRDGGVSCGSGPSWRTLPFYDTGGHSTIGCGFGSSSIPSTWGASSPDFICEPNRTAPEVGSFELGTGTQVKTAGCWNRVQTPGSHPYLAPGIYYDDWTQPLPAARVIFKVGHGTPLKERWDDAVAEPGTQPSDPTKPEQNIVVPQLTDFPFQLMPYPLGRGRPTVTVPDVHVPLPGPGSGPAMPPVVVAPPGFAPDYPKKDKSKKVNVRNIGLASGVWLAGNFVTESIDFLSAMHKALPKKLQCKGKRGGRPNPVCMARAVTKHWDKLDAAKAVEGYLNNQIEDFAYGSIGRLQTKATQRLNINTGLSHALSYNQRGLMMQADQDLPIPEFNWTDDGQGLTVSFGSVTFRSDPMRDR